MSSEHSTPESFAAGLVGRTIHVLRGTKYQGSYAVTRVVRVTGDWVQFEFQGAHGMTGVYSTRPEDAFHAEDDARAEGRARRKPRQPRRPRRGPALYGDYAQLAAFHRIATDGTGRYLGPPAS